MQCNHCIVQHFFYSNWCTPSLAISSIVYSFRCSCKQCFQFYDETCSFFFQLISLDLKISKVSLFSKYFDESTENCKYVFIMCFSPKLFVDIVYRGVDQQRVNFCCWAILCWARFCFFRWLIPYRGYWDVEVYWSDCSNSNFKYCAV